MKNQSQYMTTNTSFNNSKNYASLYGISGSNLTSQQNPFPSTSQKLKNHADQILGQSPTLIDLNITPYVPKTMNQQSYQQKVETAQDQTQNQDSQYHQRKQSQNETKSLTPQDQNYNFNYMHLINQQNSVGNGLNSQITSQVQPQPNKQQLTSENPNLNNFSVHNPHDSIVNAKTPTFVYSNQIINSPQLSYNGVNDTMKNIYSQLSPQVINEENSNKQSSLNLQSNNNFDMNQSEANRRNISEQFNESDLILNNLKSPYQYTNSNNQNNSSLQQVQNQYYHRSTAFIKPITHKDSESNILPFIKHNDYNSTKY